MYVYGLLRKFYFFSWALSEWLGSHHPRKTAHVHQETLRKKLKPRLQSINRRMDKCFHTVEYRHTLETLQFSSRPAQ